MLNKEFLIFFYFNQICYLYLHNNKLMWMSIDTFELLANSKVRENFLERSGNFENLKCWLLCLSSWPGVFFILLLNFCWHVELITQSPWSCEWCNKSLPFTNNLRLRWTLFIFESWLFSFAFNLNLWTLSSFSEYFCGK